MFTRAALHRAEEGDRREKTTKGMFTHRRRVRQHVFGNISAQRIVIGLLLPFDLPLFGQQPGEKGNYLISSLPQYAVVEPVVKIVDEALVKAGKK
jgi:hypothetical protein